MENKARYTKYIRVKKDNNYTVVDNDYLRRDDLSLKAKGLLTYLLSLPSDWEVNFNDLVKRNTDGKASLRSAWNELIKHGYIERTQEHKDGLFSYYNTVIIENPSQSKSTQLLTDFQHTDFQHTDFQDTENRTLLNTNILNTNKLNTNNSNNIVEQVISYLNLKTGKQYNANAKKNKELIKAKVKEGYEYKDFKKVIDNKVTEWQDVAKMKKYLRPSTLFSNKFDSYLNEDPSSDKDDKNNLNDNDKNKILNNWS